MVEEPLALRSPCQRPYYDNQDMDTAYPPTLDSRGGVHHSFNTVHLAHTHTQSE